MCARAHADDLETQENPESRSLTLVGDFSVSTLNGETSYNLLSSVRGSVSHHSELGVMMCHTFICIVFCLES